jgi:para-aminobenzoate synthetase component 1
MQRKIFAYSFDSEILIDKLVTWSNRFDPCILLNSNPEEQFQNDKYHSYDKLLAVGSVDSVNSGENVFDALKTFHDKHKDWIFGYLSYEVKNHIEKLHSHNYDGINADDYFFIRPRYVFEFKGKELKVYYLPELDSEETIIRFIEEIQNQKTILNQPPTILQIKSRVKKAEYIDTVNKIKKHIRRGDIYEMNYCIEYYSEQAVIDPVKVYSALNNLSPMPFSTFLKTGVVFLMCASPERFLAKRKNKIISQPIKGTAKRGANEKEDKLIAQKLKNNPKEQSENVMIVDLVRNDLSRTASKGSVQVEELFGVKTFRRLHQMVSTVTSELKEGMHFTDAIKYAFPMGSMTGAPKIRAMELIEEFESTKRGIFSGTVGYVSPHGDFDFNVVIRSIVYNAESHYLSFMAGSAITDGADAEMEYEECQLKAEGMRRVLEG